MKILLPFLLLIYSTNLFAQQDSVAGKVYVFKNMPQTVDNNRIYTPIVKPVSTTHFENFRVHHSTLKAGHSLRPAHTQKSDEELIIIDKGKLSVTINGKSKVLGAGSVLLIMPGDEQMINNLDSNPASYYVFIYRSKAPKDSVRAVSAGGSMIIDYNDITFKAHDKGGRRDFFNRPTAMCKRLEMHVTTLNEGLKSHELHKHFAEEIILMVQGDAKEQIGESLYEGTAGDLFFLPSNILHNITNTGKGQAVYFAFQFE
jgi:(S)-ureidoglycine aminohydrolase